MQQMFATVNPQQNISQMKKCDNATVDESNFNTMQNMFKTVQMSQIPQEGQSISGSQIPQVPDPNDFSTMQNLFATQKLSGTQL